MKRIDTSTKAVDLHGAGKHGFKDGNKALGIAATKLDASLFNNVQEEICRVIETAGIALDGAVYNQLLLALRAAGVFTTAAQFDNTTKAATTAFVKRALGSMRDLASVAGAATLDAGVIGKLVECSGAVNYTVTLPAASVEFGAGVGFYNVGTGIVTIQRAGADVIQRGDVGTLGSATSISLAPGDTAFFFSNGVSSWDCVGGSASLKESGAFRSSLNVSGYQKLPSGLILQWGQNLNVSSTQGSVTVTFPIAFPNSCLNASATLRNVTASGAMEWGTQVVSFTQTQLVLFNQIYPNSSGTSFDGYYWFAIGN